MNYPVQLFIVLMIAMITVIWKVNGAIAKSAKPVEGEKGENES